MELKKSPNNKKIKIEDARLKASVDRTLDDVDDELFVKKNKKHSSNTGFDKKSIAFLTTGIVGLIGGIACLVTGIMLPQGSTASLEFTRTSQGAQDNSTYSILTGEPLADSSLRNAPVYCMQTPNGTDGARPQAGLTEAGVVFEAIAEAGITRFAAIYQNPSSSVIGPIRSLRIYFLDWDTPFDCTIVHAGGADDALAAVSSGGYKDLSEDYAYMYRGTYGSRLWNNLFTTSAYLQKYSTDHGYTTSDIKGFARMTPAESARAKVDAGAVEKLNITQATSVNTSEIKPTVDAIAINMGGFADFNINYRYNPSTNTYDRSYASGAAHEVYKCGTEDLGEKNPEDVCELTQVSPSVVVAMIVQEGISADGYHESIGTTGTGDAYIFQNGTAIKGSWSKASKAEQIKFFDESGKEIALAPGQTFVTAVPAYGSVEY